jgi:hypothetical protein
MSENNTGRYLKYAIGEIILVVIGILIALQINNWNQSRLDKKKEQSYLLELKASLESDQLQIQQVLDFNVSKDSIILNFLGIFDSNLSNEQRFKIINANATPFTHYELFIPNYTTWNNFLSAENIDLIHNQELRTLLTEYYSFNYEGSVQERIKIMNRKIVDESYPKFFTKEYTEQSLNLKTDLPPNSEFDLHKNQTFLSDLFGSRYLLNEQNIDLKEFEQEIDHILELINTSLK